MLNWTPYEAACYLQGINLLDFEEFQKEPPFYHTNIENFKAKISSREDEEVLKLMLNSTTRYPDIEYYYKLLLKAKIKFRVKTSIKKNSKGTIEKAEPMVWIRWAKENDLMICLEAEEAWDKYLFGPKKRYDPKNLKLTTNKKCASRPMHECDDRLYVMERGREIACQYQDQEIWRIDIAKLIRQEDERSRLYYDKIIIMRWLGFANAGKVFKGRPKKNRINIFEVKSSYSAFK
jgi:hypothetical protein